MSKISTITSLQFDVKSGWDGSGIRDAIADIDRLKEALDTVHNTDVSINLDDAAALESIDRLKADLDSISGKSVDVRVTVDSSQLNVLEDRLTALDNSHYSARVSVQADYAELNAIEARLKQFDTSRYRALAEVDTDDIELVALNKKLDAFGHMHAVAVAEVNAKSTALDAEVAKLNAFGAMHKEAIAEVNAKGAALDAEVVKLKAFGAMRAVAEADVNTNNGVTHLSQLSSSFDDVGKKSQGLIGSMGSLSFAIAALGPAIVPITVAAAGAAGALGSMAVIGGAAAGVFGLAVKAAFGNASKAAQKLGVDTTAAAASMKQSLDNSKAAFYTWGGQVAGVIQGPVETALGALSSSFFKLTPLVSALVPEANRMADAFRKWVGSGLQGWVQFMISNGVPILHNIDSAMISLSSVFGSALRAFAPLAVAMSKFIADMAAKAQTWATGGGFDRFVALVRANAPAVEGFFKALWGAITNVFKATSQLAPSALTLATALLRVIENCPPATISAIVQAFVAFKSPIGYLITFVPGLASAFGSLLSRIPPQAIQAIAVAFVAWKTAMAGMAVINTVTASLKAFKDTAVLTNVELGLMRIQEIAVGVASGIAAAAEWIWTAAQTALDIATGAFAAILDSLGIGELLALIGLIIAAIIALVVGIEELIKHWRGVWTGMKDFAKLIWDGMKIAWQATIGAIIKAIDVLTTAKTWVNVWHGMEAAAKAIWEGMKIAWTATVHFFETVFSASALAHAWSNVWNAMKVAAQAIWDGMKIAWSAFINTLATVWNTVSNGLKAAWDAVWNAMKVAAQAVWTAMQIAWTAFVNLLTSAWNAVSGALTTAWNVFWNALKTAAEAVWNALQIAWQTFINFLTSAWNAVSGALTSAWNAVWNGLSTAAQAIWNAMQAAWSAFVNALTTVWNTVSAALTAAWNAVWNALSTAAQAIWNAMQAAWSAFVNALTTVWNTVSAALSAAWNAVWNAMKTAAQAIWTAMQAAWQAFLSTVQSIWNTISSALSAAWNAVWNAMKTAAQAIWQGMQAAWNAFLTTVRSIWNTISSALQSAWNAFWNTLKTIAQGIWDGLKSAWNAFLNFVKSIWDSISATIKSAWHTFWTDLQNAVQSAVNTMKTVWNTIEKVFGTPIEFVIVTVINKGILAAINWVISKLGGSGNLAVPDPHLPTFAQGGHIQGPGTGTSDSIMARVSAGEYIMPAQRVQEIGVNNMDAMRAGVTPGFAQGGLAGMIPGSGVTNAMFPGFAGGGTISAAAAAEIASLQRQLAISTDPTQRALIQKDITAATAAAQASAASAAKAGGSTSGGGVVTTASSPGAAPSKPTGVDSGGLSASDIEGAIKGVIDALAGAAAGVAGKAATTAGTALKAPVSGAQSIAKKIPGVGGAISDVIGFLGGGSTAAGNGLDAIGSALLSWGQAEFDKGTDALINLVIAKLIPKIPNPGGTTGPIGQGASKNMATQFLHHVRDDMSKFLFGQQQKQVASFSQTVGAIPAGAHLAVIDAALAAAGIPPPGTKAQWEVGMNTLVSRESAWNPNAINRTDSNAAAGHPSQGLAQTIPSTFQAFHVAGTSNNILDPVANLAAAMRYIVATYGNITNVQQAFGSTPKGYSTGTDHAMPGWHMIDENGGEWINFRGGERVLPHGTDPHWTPRDHDHDRHHGDRPVNVSVTHHWNGDYKPTGSDMDDMCNKLTMAVKAGVGGRPR